MLTIDDIRSQYPGAKDLSDAEVLSRISKVTQLPLEQVAQDFGIADPRKAPKGAIGGLNDFMINTANAAVGGVKSAIDFVSPGSSVAGSLDEFIKSGEQKLSLQERLSQERLSQGLDTSDIGTQAGAVLKRVTEAPFQVAGQAIGSFAIPGTTIKGARGVAGALGVGERAALRAAEVGPITPRMAQGAASQALDRVGTGAGMLTGAALAGGDAAGEAYDRVLEKTGDRALATQAAREASIVPAMIGGASSLFGADRAIARGGSKSILRTTAGEFGGEFIEEGVTKLSANLATSQYVPNTNVMAGVFGSGLLGGIQGLGTGLAVGLATKQHSILGDANQPTGDAGLKTDGSGIGKAININDAETTQKSAIPPNGVINVTAGGTALVTPEQQKAYDQYGRNQMGPFQPPPAPPAANTPNAQAQSGQVAAANAQNNQQKQQQATQQQFTELASVYGLTGGQPGKPFSLAGKNLFTQGDAETFLRSIDKLSEGKTLEQKKAMGAVLAANAIKVKPNATPQQVVGAVNKFLDGWSLSSATSQDDFIARLEANIQTVEGSKALDQAGALNDIYRHITGQDSPAFVALQKAAEVENQPKTKQPSTKKAAPPLPAAQQPSAPTSADATAIAEAQARIDAENATQTTTGAVNEQPILQNNAGIREVSVQGGAAGSIQGGNGVIQSQSIQPVGAGSVAGGQNSLENDTSGTGGARSSTNELPTTNVPDRELTEAEEKIKELIVASFGKRDADIIYDVLMNDLSGPKIAKKYGISQQRVDQIAGPKAQKGWSKRIEKAAGRLGMTIDDVEALFEPHKNNTSEANKEKENQLSAATTSQADAIAEAQARLDAELADKGNQPPTTEDDTKPEEKEKEIQPTDIESTTLKLSDEFDKDASGGRGFGDDLSGDREKTPKYGAGVRIFQIGQSGEVGLEDASSSNRSYAKFKKSGAAKLEEYEVNNILAEVEDLTDDEITSLIDRARELETRRIAKADEERNKGKENAVQESSTEEVPVRQRAGRGKAVAEGNTKGGKAAPEGKTETKTEVKAPVAPVGFRYSIVESPAYDGVDPLSQEDADFELSVLLERAKKGKLTPESFAQSEIAKRLDTAQVMTVNEGLRTDQVATVESLIKALQPTSKTETKTEVEETVPTDEEMKDAGFTSYEIDQLKRKPWPERYRQIKAGYKYIGGEFRQVTQADVDTIKQSNKQKQVLKAEAKEKLDKRFAKDPNANVSDILGSDWGSGNFAREYQDAAYAFLDLKYGFPDSGVAILESRLAAANKANGVVETPAAKEKTEVKETPTKNTVWQNPSKATAVNSPFGYAEVDGVEYQFGVHGGSKFEIEVAPIGAKSWEGVVVRDNGDKREGVMYPGSKVPAYIPASVAPLLTKLSQTKKTDIAARDALMGKISEAFNNIVNQAEATKTPEQRWTEAVAPFDGAPWDSLSKDQQDRITDLVQRGRFNLAAANKIASEKPVETTTAKQKDDAKIVEKGLGGSLVWQEGPIALVRGHSILSGQPVYHVAVGTKYTRIDVEGYTGNLITPEQKANLIEQKKRLETEAAAKHKSDPFITFNADGVAVSKNVSPELVGVITGWKKLLGLTSNIYVTTIEDARADINNFTGPHRAISSSALDSREKGSMRRMPDGSYYIAFTKSTSKTLMLEVIAHEMGHIHEREAFKNAPKEVQEAIIAEHKKWSDSQKGKTGTQLVESLRARAAGRATRAGATAKAEDMSAYWFKFGEWYADQVSRWAVTSEKPLSVVDKFFSRLAAAMKKFYYSLKGQKYLPSDTMKQFLDKSAENLTTQEMASDTNNLAAADTIDDEPQYSRSEESVTEILSAQELRNELDEFMGSDTSAKIEIITDEADLPKSVRDSKDFKSGFQAVVADGVVYMNAPKISKGTGRAVLMHELGVHLGLQKLLSGQDQAALIAQIKSWSKLTNGSLESQIAQAAMSRVDAAGTTEYQRNSELLAYFVEEAVLSGINPAATTATKSVFEKFVRRIYAAFKSAIHRLRLKSDKLSAQDVVDLAYGAARLSLTGSFHGTGAKFRKFNHQYMGSGEGAQAYGWGSYFAQKFGIANSYRATESNKKRVSEVVKVLKENIGATIAYDLIDPGTQDPIIYAGDKLTKDTIPSLAAAISKVGIDEIRLTWTDPKSGIETSDWLKLPDSPYGNIHMVDFAIANDEWLDYDTAIRDQPQKIQDLVKAISDDLHYASEAPDQNNIDQTREGQDYYDSLKQKFKMGVRSATYSSPEFDAAIQKGQFDKAVSLYLDHMGIKGIKFLDKPSRVNASTVRKIKQLTEDVRETKNLLATWQTRLATAIADEQRGNLRKEDPRITLHKGGISGYIESVKKHLVFLENDIVKSQTKLDTYLKIYPKVNLQATRNSVVFNDKNILRVSTKTAQSNYNKLQYSFAGTVALKRSGNPDNMANFVAAKLMESQGESAENIWENTGWYHGADGKWRFEIDDSKAKFTFPATPKPGAAARKAFANASYTLKDFLDHPDLYNVYPELRNIPVIWHPFGDDEEAALVFNFLPNSLKVSNIDLNGNSIQTEKSLIHEVQHAIQVIEKFNGGSSISVFDALNYSLDKNGNISRITLAQVGKLRELVKNPDFLADQYFSDVQRNKVDKALQGLELAIKHKASDSIIWNIQRNFSPEVETILAYISYRLVAGEVEANNTANRLILGEMGRSLIFPGETTGGISKDAEILTKEKLTKTLRTSIEATRQLAEDKISKLPKPYQGALHTIADTLANIARKGITGLAFTKDLAGMAAQRGLTSALNYVNLMGQRQAIKTENERKVEKIIQAFDKLDANLKSTGPGSVNAFLKESTLSGKWGFDPSWISGVKVDKDLADKFDALPVQAQNVVKSVFRHGFDTLAAMKKGVMDNINSEYDALIADAQARGDAKDTAELQKKKIESLQNYQSMMAVNAKSPYTPLKRFGNYVVVGRSAEYLDAETAAEDTSSTPEERAEARKQLRKYETDEKHYFVQFAETDAEAKAIARDTQRTYPGGLVQNFQKDQVRDKLYGGRDIQGVFYRLRNLINDSQEEKGIAEASKKSLNRLVNDLHLSLLSEHSARQSERQRKGIAGADEDMMRAFVTQGRATAHFISTLHNTGQIYDSLRDMKKEANARTDGRDVRSQYYNEMLKRHAMTLDYQVSPVIDKAMSVTSTWMLLTSPAYYLQNMTQPFMLSLPVLAAKHGYAKSASAMTTAYRELTSVLSKNGLGEETYGKLPSDVRAAIESLVNSGHIDISLSQDLGRWRSSGDQNAAAKALDKIKSISEDVEAINRVVTAVAAYRLEKNTGASQNKAVEYAGKVVYDTHGDYSGFNAPRVSRQGFGRLATQFRKFQLIQISLIAKLSSQAFGNSSPAERAIGKKALAYTLTHTFAVGGLMGMPGFAAIAWIIGKVFGDSDEPDNPEATLRKMIGDDALADLLLKGIPKLAGVDLSGKLGMGQMLSILPYTDIELSRDGYAKVVAAAMGPFIGGIMPKVVDGVAQMANGEYYKGIETMAPTGLGQAMKGYRVGTEGLTKRNGEVILSPDEITFFDAFMQGIGLPTNTITDRQFINRTEIKYEQFYDDRTSDIKRDYISAYKSGNSEAMEEARQDWRDMQDSRRKNGFKIQPMSDLFKAPQAAMKREVKTNRTLNTSGTTSAGFQLR